MMVEIDHFGFHHLTSVLQGQYLCAQSLAGELLG